MAICVLSVISVFLWKKYLGTGFIAHFEKRDILGWVGAQRTVAKKEKTIACAASLVTRLFPMSIMWVPLRSG